MRPGIPVRGRLQLTNSNGSSPPDLQRLSAIMRPVGAQLWRAPRLEVESDGSLASAGNVPGRYNVVSPDSQGWIADSMTQGGQPVVDDILELGDTAITDLVVTFSNTPSRVSGSIADASGARDVATNVLVIAATATTGEISSRRVCLTAATPAATFDCVGLPPGDYVAVAVPVDTVMYLEDPGSLGPLIEGATRFTLAAGETKSLALRTFSPRGR
jgi:hypothetical protein